MALFPQEKTPETELFSSAKMSMSSVMEAQRPPPFMKREMRMRKTLTQEREIFCQVWNLTSQLRWNQKTALRPKVNLLYC